MIKTLLNTSKKLLLPFLVTIGLHANAASLATLTLTNGVFTNFPLLNAGPVKVAQISVQATTTNFVSVQFVDTPTNSLTYTNAAYSNILSYATNVVSNYVNYYGVTNAYTNIAMVDLTNAVVAGTNSYPVRISLTVPGGNTYTIQGVNYYFTSGLWVTNTTVCGAGTNGVPATINITYVQ